MDNDMYSIALEARVYWAHYRVSMVARDEKRADRYLGSALKSAQRCGEIGARAELEMPHLLSDVPRLSSEWGAEFKDVRMKLMTLRTREGLTAWIKAMADEAIVGCGQVYELFEKRFSGMVDSRLDDVEPEYRATAIEIAKPHGYATAGELSAAWKEIEASGGCSLTGIDPWCCPCGRHERIRRTPVNRRSIPRWALSRLPAPKRVVHGAKGIDKQDRGGASMGVGKDHLVVKIDGDFVDASMSVTTVPADVVGPAYRTYNYELSNGREIHGVTREAQRWICFLRWLRSKDGQSIGNSQRVLAGFDNSETPLLPRTKENI